MIIEEKVILKELSDGFNDDLVKVRKLMYYYSTVPFFIRDFITRVNNLNFCFRQSIITFEEYESFLCIIKDVKYELKKLLERRMVWLGNKLKVYIPNADNDLIICNAYNDLFTDLDFNIFEVKNVFQKEK